MSPQNDSSPSINVLNRTFMKLGVFIHVHGVHAFKSVHGVHFIDTVHTTNSEHREHLVLS
jgi:hypothetical protein